MSVLLLSDIGTKLALRNPEIAGRTRIGRGQYSVVFERGQHEVLRFTCDPVTYGMHCDGVLRLSGTHFAKVTRDHGEIGTQRSGDIPIYLFGTERLQKVMPATAEKRLASQLVKLAGECFSSTRSGSLGNPYDEVRTMHALEKMSDSKDLPFSMRKALSDLASYAGDMVGACLDLHPSNIMQRPGTGELILNDPLHDRGLLIARHQSIVATSSRRVA